MSLTGSLSGSKVCHRRSSMTVSRIAVLVISLIVCVAGAHSQNSGAATQSGPPHLLHDAGVPEQDIALIKKLWDGWHEAYVSADPKWYEKNFSSSFLRINADGTVLNKEQMIQTVQERKQDTTRKISESPDDQHIVKYYGDTLIDAGHSTGRRGVSKGREIEFSGWLTEVLVRRNGRWQVAAMIYGNDKPK